MVLFGKNALIYTLIAAVNNLELNSIEDFHTLSTCLGATDSQFKEDLIHQLRDLVLNGHELYYILCVVLNLWNFKRNFEKTTIKKFTEKCEAFLERSKNGFVDLKAIPKVEDKTMDRVAAIIGAIVLDKFLAS